MSLIIITGLLLLAYTAYLFRCWYSEWKLERDLREMFPKEFGEE